MIQLRCHLTFFINWIIITYHECCLLVSFLYIRKTTRVSKICNFLHIHRRMLYQFLFVTLRNLEYATNKSEVIDFITYCPNLYNLRDKILPACCNYFLYFDFCFHRFINQTDIIITIHNRMIVSIRIIIGFRTTLASPLPN